MESELPLVVLPRQAEPEPCAWASQIQGCAERYLSRLGCILFRGFGVAGPQPFRRFASAFGQPLLSDVALEEEADADAQSVHGELAGQGWPLWRWLQGGSARTGGVSQVTDGREVFRRIPKGLRARFMDRGLLYTRDFSGLDASAWGSRAAVTNLEAWWRARGWRCEWQPRGGLRIGQRGLAALPHPHTGELVWFNRAHCCAASREVLPPPSAKNRAVCRVWYANGAAIERGVIEEIRGVFAELALTLAWEEGDVLMLDNLVMSHAHAAGDRAPATLFAPPCFTLSLAGGHWPDGLVAACREADELGSAVPVP